MRDLTNLHKRMEEGRKKRVRTKSPSSGSVDRLSALPDDVICKVLSNLKTKDVVKTSVLSPRWRNLWKNVPTLNLAYNGSPNYDTLVSFVDRYLDFNSESPVQSFKLLFNDEDGCGSDFAEISRWVDTVIERKVEHVNVQDEEYGTWFKVEIPPSIYTCKSLVTLKLSAVTVDASPDVVSLPCLKSISLDMVQFDDDSDFETLILGCPILQKLYICKRTTGDTGVVRVFSQSLLSFSLVVEPIEESEELEEYTVVTIDAPRLEYLNLTDRQTPSIIVENCGSLVKADIDIGFNLFPGDELDPDDIPEMINKIYNFLLGISTVKDLAISAYTLKIIYDYSIYADVPLFHNLSFLRAGFWEMLPIFLESCPNLKSIFVGSANDPKNEEISTLSEPRSVLSALEYAEIYSTVTREGMEMKLVKYFLEKSPILKTLTIRLDVSERYEESVVLKEIMSIPRLSTSCSVVVNYEQVWRNNNIIYLGWG